MKIKFVIKALYLNKSPEESYYTGEEDSAHMWSNISVAQRFNSEKDAEIYFITFVGVSWLPIEIKKIYEKV